MTIKDMKEQLSEYNWDDGFILPQKIVSDTNCDLATALEIFYLADGFTYLTDIKNTDIDNEWYTFVKKLYQNIEAGKYKTTSYEYKIPLSKTQCYLLKKNMIPDIFINDVLL